jgi:hypothetical protein
MTVIFSKSLARDTGGKPGAAFPHPALKSLSSLFVANLCRKTSPFGFLLKNFLGNFLRNFLWPVEPHPRARALPDRVARTLGGQFGRLER